MSLFFIFSSFFGNIDVVSWFIVRRLSSFSQKKNKQALIVPAFETGNSRLKMPQTKAEVLSLMTSKDLVPFNFYNFKPGHRPTNYTQWENATTPYKVSLFSIFCFNILQTIEQSFNINLSLLVVLFCPPDRMEEILRTLRHRTAHCPALRYPI